MKRFAMEFRVVEAHYYEVEALTLEDVEMRVYDEDLEPHEINPVCYELEDGYVMADDEKLTPAEYNDLRRENADWLSGKDKVGMP